MQGIAAIPADRTREPSTQGPERDPDRGRSMRAGRLTVATSQLARGSGAMVEVATTVARDNPPLNLRIIDTDPDEAIELGVMTCPALGPDDIEMFSAISGTVFDYTIRRATTE